MQVRSLGFVTDLMIRRISGSDVSDLGDHIVVRTPTNPTFHWGNFILVGDDYANADRWIETFDLAFPDSGHLAIGLDLTVAPAELLGAYESRGLEADVSTVLATSRLIEPSPLAGVDCRPLRTDDEWQQMLELTLIVNEVEDDEHRRFSELKSLEWRRLVEAGHGAWFGAFVDQRLRASLGIFTDGAGLGRYQAVGTHPDFRRRGLAAHLLTTASRWMVAQHQVRSLVIVAEPHAVNLYRSVGFVDADVAVQFERSD